jgi:hypothetical protein
MPQLKEKNSAAQAGWASQLPSGSEPPEEATRAGTRGQPAQWTRTSDDTPSQGEDAQAHHQVFNTSGDSGSPLLPSSRSANKRRCMSILRRQHENDEEVTITSRMDEEVHRLLAAKPRKPWWVTTRWLKTGQLRRSSER